MQNRAGFKKLFILNKNKAENLNGDYKAFTVCLWLLVCTEKKTAHNVIIYDDTYVVLILRVH